jgi:hypothetical protein
MVERQCDALEAFGREAGIEIVLATSLAARRQVEVAGSMRLLLGMNAVNTTTSSS